LIQPSRTPKLAGDRPERDADERAAGSDLMTARERQVVAE
jgi:hypothetical protein